MKAVCPIDICPQYPDNMFNPWRAITVTAVELIKASQKSLTNTGKMKKNKINMARPAE
jgi:hypothetical protein